MSTHAGVRLTLTANQLASAGFAEDPSRGAPASFLDAYNTAMAGDVRAFSPFVWIDDELHPDVEFDGDYLEALAAGDAGDDVAGTPTGRFVLDVFAQIRSRTTQVEIDAFCDDLTKFVACAVGVDPADPDVGLERHVD